MRKRKAILVTLTLLVAADMSVAGAVAAAQTTKSSKSPAVKPGTKMRRGKTSKRSIRRVRGQKEPTSDRISEIQTALGKDGSFSGAPNGKWDSATVDAMKKFQESHGLSPSGKLDAKTLQKLGLGSQTAGLAPPMPPVNSSSLNTSPSNTVPRPQ
jgi:peptidoglycan hydrolase-like protein with peptidoglycan-binding domain